MSVGAKFIALTNYLKASGKQTIRLSFSEIETILGFTLSPCKRNIVQVGLTVQPSRFAVLG